MGIRSEIGERLRDSGLTYREIGERIGCTAQNVWQAVNEPERATQYGRMCKRNMTVGMAESLCGSIGLEICMEPCERKEGGATSAPGAKNIPVDTMDEIMQRMGFRMRIRVADGASQNAGAAEQVTMGKTKTEV